MILINESHELFKPMLGLQSLLLCFPVFIGFFLSDGLLRFVALLKVLSPDLGCYEILMHSFYHVLVCSLEHQLKVMSLFDILQSISSGSKPICLSHISILDVVFFKLGLFKFFLQIS